MVQAVRTRADRLQRARSRQRRQRFYVETGGAQQRGSPSKSVDAIKEYLAKQLTMKQAATAAKLPVIAEAVAKYGFEKFSDFSDALILSLRLVN